ncbi:LD-carboxypeptidase [Clostridium sp. YIM B02506]|uniref:S66 peptidase family protein n=1 Tax=Clostridium sp. YIM B02506 TaxID=2910680 RepID=UPI001EEE6523|nr:LD-carboxypeptidase [Clostridium sp. YIM B02506]
MLAKALKNNDLIGIVSPAFCEDIKVIDDKIDTFKKLGFNLLLGKHLYSRSGYFAGESIDRASDLMNMFENKDVKAIICFRGGYGSINILPYLNYSVIKKNPKILCGYSDLTTLINYINKKTGLVTFHGPMVNSDFNDEQTLESLKFTLMQGYSPYNIPFGGSVCYNEGNTTGILAGGNLATICSTLGTPYEINFNNKVLLIEEVNEYPYSLDRMLSQLLYSGKLSKCKGFILGHFTNCTVENYSKSYTVEDIIKNILVPLNKPIITGFSFGHDYPNLTLPIGSKIKLNFTSKYIEIMNNVVI